MAETIDFKAPEIGLNKAVKVAKSNGNLRKVWQLQLALAESETDKELTVEEETTLALTLLDKSEAFLIDLLKLNAKQKQALEDTDQKTLYVLVAQLSAKLQGVSIEPTAEDEEAPK